MKLSEMRELLSRQEIQLTKSLGQNFLHDPNQLRRIVDAAEFGRSDHVLEIGPGLGPLTELLLERAGSVLAIEKDARLVSVLKDRFAGALAPATSSSLTPATPRLTLLHDDALRYLQREPHDWTDWKLISNLPYSVASPILVELALAARPPERLVVTLQLEVARRLMAAAGDEDYGVLTLLVQLNFEPGHWFKIPRSCFFPEPDVDSACVTLLRRKKSPLSSISMEERGGGRGGASVRDETRNVYVALVKRAFSQRRKMMFKLLKADWEETVLRRAFEKLQLDEKVRAETLSRDQFVALANELATSAATSPR